jgi:hypothetical protein
MECQRNGTAVPSLATEYLQEVDHLSGIERQQAAQTITDTLGSMFQGKSPRSLRIHEALTLSVQLVLAQYVSFSIPLAFLLG